MADFITKLSLVQGYNSILVVVDWLNKMVYFIPTTEKTSAEGLARLFRDNVWKLHGLLERKDNKVFMNPLEIGLTIIGSLRCMFVLHHNTTALT